MNVMDNSSYYGFEDKSIQQKGQYTKLAANIKDSAKNEKRTESPSKLGKMLKRIESQTITRSENSCETLATSADFFIDTMNEISIFEQPINIKVSVVLQSNGPSAKNGKKDEQENSTIKSIMMSIDSSIYPQNVLKHSIDEFNKIFEAEKLRFLFSPNSTQYKLKPSKKDGKPKNDYPAIDFETPLKDTGILNFSLIYNSKDLIEIKEKKKECCNNCIIY